MRLNIDRRVMLGCLFGSSAAALLPSCARIERFRYRMVVVVDTPRGVKRGAAVREVSITSPPKVPMLGEDRGGVGVNGEAVIVDIAPGKTLFALLSGADGQYEFGGRDVSFLFRELAPTSPDAIIELWPVKPVTRRPILENPLPALVTFKDLRDPMSLTRLDANDLASTFGLGVALKEITIQRTDAPVTEEIEKRINWLDDLKRYRTDPSNPFTNRLPRGIGDLKRN